MLVYSTKCSYLFIKTKHYKIRVDGGMAQLDIIEHTKIRRVLVCTLYILVELHCYYDILYSMYSYVMYVCI